MSFKTLLVPSLLLALSLHSKPTSADPVDQLASPTPARRNAESLTSRELRAGKSVQIGAGLGPLLIIPSLSLGLDYYLNEQLSVGATANVLAVVIAGSVFLSGEAHIKRFLGNSFYVKLLTGALVWQESGDDVMPTRTGTDFTLQMNIGNEWFFNENFGWSLSYITLGYRYNYTRSKKKQPFGAPPSIGIFGSF